MCRVLNILGFWVFQDCEYARVLNFQSYTVFTYFCKYYMVLNMSRDRIMEGFWIFQYSKYARLLHMQALHKVPDMAEYGWIIPEEAILTMLSREYAWSNFHRVLNMPQVLNMPGLGIWQGYEKMRVTHGVKYTWISLTILF